jgi:uncharacterized pyridoxal phosphate-dependent enzyme
MDVYAELGVEPVINAAGTLTRFSGSLVLPEVAEAMLAASRSYVDMNELHLAAGRRLASLLDVEAAHVCNSAAAGIALMAAACMTGTDRGRITRLPDVSGMRHLFVVQRSHHNPFDQALRLTGGQFVDVDADAGEIARTLEQHQESVAAVYATVAWFCTGQSLPIAQLSELAHAAGVPLIVDAAAEVPPLDNLTRFLREGADLVAFSGGKAIRGPQASGFILGRAGLVEACRLNDNPNSSIGRPMKAGKEEIAGLVKAVELYVARDHAADQVRWQARVERILQAVADLPGVRGWQQLPFGTGQLIPHAAISWDEQQAGLSHASLVQRLLEGRPRIAAQLINAERYAFGGYTQAEVRFHPHTLEDGQEEIVARRLRELLATR